MLMIFCQDIFNELQVDYHMRTNELSKTKSVLADTEDILKVTETQLLLTKQERDENKHLVEKHVATEKVLSSQARQLLGVADTATTDTYKLHDKIVRKT